MEQKIYIVTSGFYSEYMVNAVFTTKEKAVDYVEQHGTDCNIEEYDLDEEVEKKPQLWNIDFCVEDGKFCEASPTSLTDYNMKVFVDTCRVEDSFGMEVKPHIHFYVDADSMDRAVKIARERFAAVKANEYIWLRLTRPYQLDGYGLNKYEKFNVKTNEFIK